LRNNEDVSKSTLYWEIALNLASIGKNHNFKKNGNLEFNCQNGWFSYSPYSAETPWCSINNVSFNYSDTNKLDVTASKSIDVSDNGGASKWSITVDSSTNLFVSWTLLNQPTI
jgi:hypothetical protein